MTTNKRVKESQVGAYVAAIGMMVSTIAHYAEIWWLSYFLAASAGLIAAIVFLEE